ncbi:MAG: hypothetical protein AAGK23_09160 [Pseudomonadota bacterium]
MSRNRASKANLTDLVLVYHGRVKRAEHDQQIAEQALQALNIELATCEQTLAIVRGQLSELQSRRDTPDADLRGASLVFFEGCRQRLAAEVERANQDRNDTFERVQDANLKRKAATRRTTQALERLSIAQADLRQIKKAEESRRDETAATTTLACLTDHKMGPPIL